MTVTIDQQLSKENLTSLVIELGRAAQAAQDMEQPASVALPYQGDVCVSLNSLRLKSVKANGRHDGGLLIHFDVAATGEGKIIHGVDMTIDSVEAVSRALDSAVDSPIVEWNRIQIAAAMTLIDVTKYSDRRGIPDKIVADFHEGCVDTDKIEAFAASSLEAAA